MPLIMPIKDLRNTTEISNIAHKEQESIFITKNGYSDLVVMSSELYDKFARMNRIDQAIFESEQEIANGAEAVDAEKVFAELEKNILDKYKVKVNPRAIRELDHIYEYIANEKRSTWIALRRVAIATRRRRRMSQATFFILIS